jgi:signal transduction histidine kinase
LPLNRASRGESVSGFRWRVRSKDGQIVELESAAVQVVGEGGQPSGAVAVDRDVTEQVRLRRQKELFLLSATHDLKNPLTEVKGRAQLLRNIVERSQPTDDRFISGLSRIDQAADRVVRRLEELLDASRTDMGVLPSHDVHEVELAALFGRVAERVSPVATQHEIQVLDETARVRGWWDAPRVERALYNILANAIK